jgi:hypothetical protein
MNTFNTVAEAAKTINVTFTSIVDCCAGRHETAGGYRWSYVGEQLPHLKRVPEWYMKKWYEAIDADNNIVGTFATLKEAAAITSAHSSGIIDCCAGRKKTAGGLKWRYVFR